MSMQQALLGSPLDFYTQGSMSTQGPAGRRSHSLPIVIGTACLAACTYFFASSVTDAAAYTVPSTVKPAAAHQFIRHGSIAAHRLGSPIQAVQSTSDIQPLAPLALGTTPVASFNSWAWGAAFAALAPSVYVVARWALGPKGSAKQTAGFDGEAFVCCTVDGEQETETEAPKKTPKVDADSLPGMRWDGANQIWIKDDRFQAKTTVTPYSGAEYTIWPVVHQRLVARGLKSVSCVETLELMKNGAILLDIRVPRDFARGHAKGSIGVPLYRYVEGNSMFDNLKRLAMAGFAMPATERNPNFVEDVLKAGIKKDDKIVVACTIGGTLDTMIRVEGRKPFASPERNFGREARSLKACYELLEAGFTDVLHLDGGLNMWFHEDHPTESTE